MSHFDDEAEVAALKKWWQENWMALAGGLVLGLAGIFGWEAWQKAQTSKSERASQIFEELSVAADAQPDRAAEMGARLFQEFPDTPYASQGALKLAQSAAQKNDWEAAERNLNWVIGNSDDLGLKKIARLRLARVLWQQGKADQALAQLDIPDDDAFATLFQELRGDIKLSQGDRAAARDAYQKAMALGPAPASAELLQRKINDLSAAES